MSAWLAWLIGIGAAVAAVALIMGLSRRRGRLEERVSYTENDAQERLHEAQDLAQAPLSRSDSLYRLRGLRKR